MPIIKKYSPFQNLSNFNTFITDDSDFSDYLGITEFSNTFTAGKNAFLIEGTPFLQENSEIKIEILDSNGDPLYYEPGDGIPEYYEGLSKLVSVHVYSDTPIGIGQITILAELENYIDDIGKTTPIPENWRGVYNFKWTKKVKINKNLPNETLVRFYKRPKIQIEEIVKPVFEKNIPFVTQSGKVNGIPELPITNTVLKDWTAGTLYKLEISSGSNWTSSIEENEVVIPELNYRANVIEVLDERNLLVDIPYTLNGRVVEFKNKDYISEFEYLEGQSINESNLNASFAKINISNLKTFAGDVYRLKIFRKSKSSLDDFAFVQESKLESVELLRDIEISTDTDIPYGIFTEQSLQDYWDIENINHTVSINLDKLYQSLKIDYNQSAGGTQVISTKKYISISSGLEYTLKFRTLNLENNLTDKEVNVFLKNDDGYISNITNIIPDKTFATRQEVDINFMSTFTGLFKLYIEIKGDGWYISNVSLKNSQETSFSPDEFTLIQDIPRKLDVETFDFKFEFYDINNNYIPVELTATKTFSGGNLSSSNVKFLNLEIDPLTFKFENNSNIPSPINQIATLNVLENQLAGSANFTWVAFDDAGNEIPQSEYIGETYPGELTNISSGSATLTVDNFLGSRNDITVSSIRYTVEKGGLFANRTISRLENGGAGIRSAPATSLRVNSEADGISLESLSQPPQGANFGGGFLQLNISDGKYALWDTAGGNINDATIVTSWDSIGYLGFAGDITSDNKFETPINRYVRDYLEIGDFVVIYIDSENYGVYTLEEKTFLKTITLFSVFFDDVSIKLKFEWGSGAYGSFSSNNTAIPQYFGFSRDIIPPGLVYRGEYNSSEVYYYDQTRQDIVLGSDSSYYLAANISKSGQSGWNNPISAIQTDWNEFGATYDSVATDILFTKDVFTERTVNVGADGGNPVISLNADYPTHQNPYIGIKANGYSDKGIFLGYDDGLTKFSLIGDGGQFFKWDGNNLLFSGEVNSNFGTLAGWVIEEGVLRDENSLIKLNSAAPAIEIYDNTGNLRVDIRQGALSDPTSTTLLSLSSPNSYGFLNEIYTNSNWIGGSKFYSSTYSTLSVSTTGVYFNTSPLWGTNVYNFASTNIAYIGSAIISLYIEIHSSVTPTTGTLVSSHEIGSSGLISSNSTLYSLVMNGNPISLTLEAGTYYVFTVWRLNGSVGGGSLTLNGSKNPSTVNLNNQVDQIEITNEGILLSSGGSSYLKAERDGNTPLLTLVQNSNTQPTVKVSNSDITGTSLEVNGGISYFNNSSSTGRMAIGELNGETTLIGQDFPNTSTNVANARLRPGTRFGISGRYLIWDSSTIRIKKDIEDYSKEDAYNSIKNIKPVVYWPLNKIDGKDIEDYNETYSGLKNPTEYIGKQGGFIAEWLDKDPNLRKFVTYDNGRVDGIAYDKLVVPTIAAMQKLIDKVEELEKEVDNLKSQISGSFI
jgi:hypothetical protein